LWVSASNGPQWSPWSRGFTVTGPVDTGPVVTPTSLSITAAHGQSFAASSLISYSDPFGDPATQYDFYDNGSGGGHFVLNGQTLSTNQVNNVTAAHLSHLTSLRGTGTDILWVSASDGAQWSPWSSGFTVSDPPTIAVGATLELPSAFSGTLSF